MDAPLKAERCTPAERFALGATALAPVLPQILGSIFNIWYNAAVVDPLLHTQELKDQFIQTVAVFNAVAYPLVVFAWLWVVFSLRPGLQRLCRGQAISQEHLARYRRRVINLPWWCVVICGFAWLSCIPVFLLSLISVGQPFDPLLLWHLPVSIIISALIAMTHSFFLVELASHRRLFPIFFRDSRADLTPGGLPISLRGRGVLWTLSASICPIASLLLLSFAPPAPGAHPQWFATFVGAIGIAFAIWTAGLMSRLVAQPVDSLRTAAKAVAKGDLDVHVPLPRPDEFGLLSAEFNYMVQQLREKEKLRRTFGLHVGRAAADHILARDPGLGGVEQVITVVFVDIRSFTARSAALAPPDAVRELNAFLGVMVDVIESRHGGMINKFLGDGFMALFGVSETGNNHAQRAVAAGTEMLRVLVPFNATLTQTGSPALRIGIGIHTGPAVVGSIGSPERLEFTAIGSTVNVAARVEQLTKELKVPLLFTEATAAHLSDLNGFNGLGPQSLRGVEEKLHVFTAADLRTALN